MFAEPWGGSSGPRPSLPLSMKVHSSASVFAASQDLAGAVLLAPDTSGNEPSSSSRSSLGSSCSAAAAGTVAAGAVCFGRARRRRGPAKTRLAAAKRGLEVPSRDQAKIQGRGEESELDLLVKGLRGQNLNDQDRQEEGLEMRLVDITSRDDETGLPLVYSPEALAEYFQARPWVVVARIYQILSTAGGLLAGSIADRLFGPEKGSPEAVELEVQRAREFRRVVTQLGPLFIKLGQALSIRPDILSPRAMVELQALCDKVPSYDSAVAMATVEDELSNKFGRPVTLDSMFQTITPEPVAAASLGQVYRAKLREPAGYEVAVKVQRPGVLATASLDLYLIRSFGLMINLLSQAGLRDSRRTDLVALLDNFAARFYEELDYEVECSNGIEVAESMKSLPRVVVPKNFPEYCTRKVHVAEWLEGEKLSQSGASDVRELVNVGVLAYLTQLLQTGFFHADPHPGNMLRTPDGRLGILDFGLMTRITDDQKYGMIEAIAHLVHRDYAAIGSDFKQLDFIPADVDVGPVVPALSRVFDSALSGGGAKAINFQELAADLAEITFEYPFRIPPYFALVIRAIGVLEGIALVGDPDFAIVDEAYPYLSKRLMIDPPPRLRGILRYMVYGREGVFDAERLIDLLRALEAFRTIQRDPSSLKDRWNPEGSQVQQAAGKGLVQDTRQTDAKLRQQQMSERLVGDRPTSWSQASAATTDSGQREALVFLFSEEGEFLREFLLQEAVNGIDCLGRSGLNELFHDLGQRAGGPFGGMFRPPAPVAWIGAAFVPPLNSEEKRVVANTRRLISFFAGDEMPGGSGGSSSGPSSGRIFNLTSSTLRTLAADPKLSRSIQSFSGRLVQELVVRANTRALRWVADQIAPGKSSEHSIAGRVPASVL